MVALFTNNGFSTLASGIGTGDTSITVDTGDGALFPSPSGSDYFYATLIDTANNLEIVKCTSRSSDVLTVTRAQEGTTATAYSSGDRIELRITAAGLTDVVDQAEAAQTAAETAQTAAETAQTAAETAQTAAETAQTNAETAEANAVAAANTIGFKYTFSSTTTMADPGTGLIRFDNATVASVTNIAISGLTAATGNPDISDFIALWDDATSTRSAMLTIRTSGEPGSLAVFAVTGTVTDNTTWLQVGVTHIASAGSIDNTDTLYIGASLSGDDGAGDITGPGASTDNAVPRWNGIAGIDIQDSGVTIDDSDNMAVPGTLTVTGAASASNLSGTNTGDEVAASQSTAGVVELAITSEVNTGTDATRAVTPDALAGSNYGTAVVQILVFDDATDVAIGDGAGDVFFRVPSTLNGFDLVGVAAQVQTAGTTGTTDVQIYNVTQAADMLLTKATIDSGETDTSTAATPAVIDIANDDVATGDQLRIDVDAVSTTAPKGLLVELQFRLP